MIAEDPRPPARERESLPGAEPSTAGEPGTRTDPGTRTAPATAPDALPDTASGLPADPAGHPPVAVAAAPAGAGEEGAAAAGAQGEEGVPATGVDHLVAALKPRLRGWLHAGMLPLVVAGGIVLLILSGSVRAGVACAVFSLTALLLFGTSALYHRGDWGPRGEAVLRRLDHANIFLIIAGTCTPLAVILLSPRQQPVLLTVVWAGALAGVAFRVLWIRAPRWLYTPCYIALGWVPVVYLADFARAGGIAVVVLIVTGGLLYTAGGIVYGLKRPNPSPRWFGFHEVFHALTVAAFSAHYTAVLLAVL